MGNWCLSSVLSRLVLTICFLIRTCCESGGVGLVMFGGKACFVCSELHCCLPIGRCTGLEWWNIRGGFGGWAMAKLQAELFAMPFVKVPYKPFGIFLGSMIVWVLNGECCGCACLFRGSLFDVLLAIWGSAPIWTIFAKFDQSCSSPLVGWWSQSLMTGRSKTKGCEFRGIRMDLANICELFCNMGFSLIQASSWRRVSW